MRSRPTRTRAGPWSRSWGSSPASVCGSWSEPCSRRTRRSRRRRLYRGSATADATPGDLPTGVVTFLLTDIEGSSGLWEADADAMAAALELHDELIAQTVNEHGGRLLKAKGEGDATLTVFRRASDAVACAVELQRTLHGAPWPGGLDLRVRVALHTGEAHERDGDYFGPALNRAARLRSVARGGATVMSQATAEIVHERLPPETGLVELGRQELRGLSRPENVFELRAIAPAGLAGESALDAPRTTVTAARDAVGGRAVRPTRSPARPADTHHRPRGGPLRHRDAVAPRRDPPGHAHRGGRGGEDAAGARGGAVA